MKRPDLAGLKVPWHWPGAERRLKARTDITVVTEDDDEPWEAIEERPEYVLGVCLMRDQGDPGKLEHVGSLWAVGVNSLDDPYLRVVAAELADEYL
jgi:hypothetical protein